jgi:hypothetical protein
MSQADLGEQGVTSFSPLKDHPVILNRLVLVVLMSFDLKKTVSGEFIVIILSFVDSHITWVSILFATVLIVAQVSCCLSMLQSYNIPRMNIFIRILGPLLAVIDDLPLIEIRRAVGLTFSVDCVWIRPS